MYDVPTTSRPISGENMSLIDKAKEVSGQAVEMVGEKVGNWVATT